MNFLLYNDTSNEVSLRYHKKHNFCFLRLGNCETHKIWKDKTEPVSTIVADESPNEIADGEPPAAFQAAIDAQLG